jgi:hypothetical protein
MYGLHSPTFLIYFPLTEFYYKLYTVPFLSNHTAPFVQKVANIGELLAHAESHNYMIQQF